MINAKAIDQFCATVSQTLINADNRPVDGVLEKREMKNLIRRTAHKPGCGYSRLARDIFEDVRGNADQVELTACQQRLDQARQSLLDAAERDGGVIGCGSKEVAQLDRVAMSVWDGLYVLDQYEPLGI